MVIINKDEGPSGRTFSQNGNRELVYLQLILESVCFLVLCSLHIIKIRRRKCGAKCEYQPFPHGCKATK